MVFINPIKNLNNINFGQGQSQAVAASPIMQAQNDSFVSQEKIEPPKINSLQSLWILTNEQIAQINKSKSLPENLRFVYVDPQKSEARQHWRSPYYKITINGPWIKNGSRQLPEGYQVQRLFGGEAAAVKVVKK